MPEQTELSNINKGIQKLVEILTVQDRKEDKREAKKEIVIKEVKKERKEIQDSNLSTWGSIKTGFDAFNVSIENDEENKITWGKLGSQVKDSVSKWYKQTKEMDNMLGATFRLGSAVWEGINKHLISNLKTAFSNVASGVREVLGPVAEAFDTMKNAIMGVFGFFKGVIGSFFSNKVKPEDKKRNKLLQGIVDYFIRSERADAAKGGKKKKLGMLGKLLFGLGIVIGAVVGAIMAPFRLLLGILRKVKPIALAINKFFGTASKFGKIIAKASKFLGPLAAGFKLGFKVLGWPLTILLGIIDAIKASWTKYKEGGTVYEIIMAGIKGAFMGLFELPIKILGWIGDKILSLFSVEIEGGLAQKIMDVLSNVFDWIINIPNMLIEAGKKLFGGESKKEDLSAFDEMGGGVDTSIVSRAEENRKKDEKLFAQRAADRKEAKRIKDEADAEAKRIADAKLLKSSEGIKTNVNQMHQTTINKQTIIESIPDEIDGSLVGIELLWDF